MALQLLLYSITCHHARHANQTFHVIVFRLLTLVKMTLRSLLRKLSILNLRSQQLIGQLFTQGSSFVLNVFLVFNWY